jgi:predicted permease
VIHPVVLPVLAGFVLNSIGIALPTVLDEVLQMLGTAVVPLCLTLIGMSLAYYGWPRAWRGVLGLAALKLLVLPALVLVVAHWGFGLAGLPLSVIVMVAALPTGSNALIFAQRYRCQEGETTAAIVASTLLFVLTAPLWLAVLSAI